jgi:demethylmenaquinone methyltransferase/2-methoxy-6-polyprenyl-1,4-benzoquinol methylase
MNRKNEQGQKLKTFYSSIYKRYDLVNRLFTLGMDVRWRKKAAAECLKKRPSSIIDLCCGTGDMVLSIHGMLQDEARVVGYDFSESMLEKARIKAVKNHAETIEFIQGDVAKMPFADGEFDCICIAFGFRNLTYDNPSRGKHVSEIARILKQGGSLIILESAVPVNRIINIFYRVYLHFILVPLGGLLSGNWKAYRYLAKSSANYMRQDEIADLLKNYGLVVNFVKPFFFGSASLITAFRN